MTQKIWGSWVVFRVIVIVLTWINVKCVCTNLHVSVFYVLSMFRLTRKY